MSFEYILNHYKKSLRRGQRVRVFGMLGVVTSATNHVYVRVDGQRHASPYHPDDVTPLPLHARAAPPGSGCWQFLLEVHGLDLAPGDEVITRDGRGVVVSSSYLRDERRSIEMERREPGITMAWVTVAHGERIAPYLAEEVTRPPTTAPTRTPA